jgi:hypothetical protein
MSTNTGNIAALLRPGLAAIVGELPSYPEQYAEIFSYHTSDKYQEIEVEMRMPGIADIKPEGMPTATDSSIGQRIITNYIHKTVGLNEILTKETIRDNLYNREFPRLAVSLRTSLRTAKNVLLTNILNNAFNAAYPIGDGQSVCSATHPVDGGFYSNVTPAPAAFSETTVETMLIQIQGFVMQSGILAQTMAKKLIIPKELQFSASRLLNSSFRVGVANNDINAMYHGDYIPEGYRVNHYLTSPTSFFILTDSPDGFKLYQRDIVETDTHADYSTNNIMMKAEERYSGGITNPRGVIGSQGV